MNVFLVLLLLSGFCYECFPCPSHYRSLAIPKSTTSCLYSQSVLLLSCHSRQNDLSAASSSTRGQHRWKLFGKCAWQSLFNRLTVWQSLF